MLNISFFNYLKKQPVRIQNTILAYNKSFLNEKDQNITVFSYQPSLDYFDANSKHMYSLELSADKINRGNEEEWYEKYNNENKYKRNMEVRHYTGEIHGFLGRMNRSGNIVILGEIENDKNTNNTNSEQANGYSFVI